MKPEIVVVEPDHFDVVYVINPWMDPKVWQQDRAGNRLKARSAWNAMTEALRSGGATLSSFPGAPALPDMVFPANSAIVLDRRALVGNFRHPERRPEKARFQMQLQELLSAGVLDEVDTLPSGVYQEGAGDCMWDTYRGHFWAGHGPRSSLSAAPLISAFFGVEVVSLELRSNAFYHLDVCFVPLSGGDVAYFPGAFSQQSLDQIRSRVSADKRIEVSETEARTLALNAVNFDKVVVTARGASALGNELRSRGYDYVEVDVDPFIRGGGGVFCMTLRLDQCSTGSDIVRAASRASPRSG